jgi:hypothetical protein
MLNDTPKHIKHIPLLNDIIERLSHITERNHNSLIRRIKLLNIPNLS